MKITTTIGVLIERSDGTRDLTEKSYVQYVHECGDNPRGEKTEADTAVYNAAVSFRREVAPERVLRAEASKAWPKAVGRDAEELRKWIMYGDYSNVADPWHLLIEEWHRLYG